jgi:hypothetical protein
VSEVWRSVPGYERTYEVSDMGQVRSQPRPRTRGGVLRQKIGKRGYPAVSLVQDGRQVTQEVHRLVAAAFLGPRPVDADVRHLDGDRLRPHASNLAYGTRSENLADALRHGTHPTASRTHCPSRHEYTPENTRVIPSRPTARYCRACEARRGKSAKDHPDYRDEWKP